MSRINPGIGDAIIINIQANPQSSSNIKKKTAKIFDNCVANTKKPGGDLNEVPTSLVKEKFSGKLHISSFFKDSTSTLSGLFSQVFSTKSEKVQDGTNIVLRTSPESFRDDVTAETDSMTENLSDTELEEKDPENLLRSLYKDILSIRRNPPSVDATTPIRRTLSDLHGKISKFEETFSNEPFPFESAYSKIKKNIGSIKYQQSINEGKIASLCSQALFGLSLGPKTPFFDERDSLLKKTNILIYKDCLTLSSLKSTIAKLKQGPLTEIENIHIKFLETKKKFLETRIAKAEKLVSKIEKQEEAERTIFAKINAENASQVFSKSWNLLGSTLQNLPNPEKLRILEKLYAPEHEHITRQATQELLYLGALTDRIASDAYIPLLEILKDLAKDLHLA